MSPCRGNQEQTAHGCAWPEGIRSHCRFFARCSTSSCSVEGSGTRCATLRPTCQCSKKITYWPRGTHSQHVVMPTHIFTTTPCPVWLFSDTLQTKDGRISEGADVEMPSACYLFLLWDASFWRCSWRQNRIILAPGADAKALSDGPL